MYVLLTGSAHGIIVCHCLDNVCYPSTQTSTTGVEAYVQRDNRVTMDLKYIDADLPRNRSAADQQGPPRELPYRIHFWMYFCKRTVVKLASCMYTDENCRFPCPPRKEISPSPLGPPKLHNAAVIVGHVRFTSPCRPLLRQVVTKKNRVFV